MESGNSTALCATECMCSMYAYVLDWCTHVKESRAFCGGHRKFRIFVSESQDGFLTDKATGAGRTLQTCLCVAGQPFPGGKETVNRKVDGKCWRLSLALKDNRVDFPCNESVKIVSIVLSFTG